MLQYEDCRPGATFAYGDELISRDAIVAFAREFDPQPMHLDEDAAKRSLLGGLAASGLHTNSLLQKMTAEHLLSDRRWAGAIGMRELRWHRPVRPGERLSVTAEVIAARESRSRRGLGLVDLRFEVAPRDGERALSADATLMYVIGEADDILAPRNDATLPRTAYRLGSFTFTETNIVAYARAFDPRPWNIDPRAAEAGPYRGLVASGWHVASVNVAVAVRDGGEAERRHHPKRSAGRKGPSPGWRDVKWLRPIRPGDTIDFHRDEAGYRPSASRPGWGLLDLASYATNQRGELVHSAISVIFVEGGNEPDIAPSAVR